MSSPQLPSPLWARSLAAITGPRRAWQVLLIALIMIVAYLATSPTPPRTIDLGWDKLNHVSAFVALTWCGCLGFPGSHRRLFGVLLAMLAFGGLIEIVQSQIPGREADWADLLADSIGMTCGALLALAALRGARGSPVRS